MRLQKKIVEFMLSRTGIEFTINELAGMLDESYSLVNRMVNKMISEGVINKKAIGNAILCSLNIENDKTRALIHVVEVGKKDALLKGSREIDLILKDFFDKVKKLFGADILFAAVFGSLASGFFKRGSDIDIFILTKRKHDLSKIVRELSAQYGIEIVPVQMTPAEFSSQKQKEFIKEIAKTHVVLLGFENFINFMWSK